VLNFTIDAFAAPTFVTTQAPIAPKRPAAPQKAPRVEMYWEAVTYKTVIVYVSLLLAIAGATLVILRPEWYSVTLKKVTNAVNNAADNDTATFTQTQAKFVNLTGKVQVKKVDSVQWVDADYRTSLDKGDLVQTAGDGAARITFADGTTYTVKAETLVTVEENLMGSNKPTSVAMRISTGSVDLATPNWASPDSKAAVSMEDTTASLSQNSRASVKNDPQNNEHEIVLASGAAEVQRGPEKVELTQWEKVSFPTGGPLQKTNVLAPPSLVEPLNLAPIISENPKITPVRFEWKAVEDAVSYTLRISTTTMFTKMVKEADHVSGTSTEITGLEPGDYFWNVTAHDAKKETSETSETFKFTVVAQGKTQEMMLEIDGTQMHGRVAEIVGRTEPGAALIVNGQPVPNISPDGTFRHFTEALDPGQHTIVVIGQNRRGGTAKQQISIVVPK
jgi:hypothetical protein